MENKGKLILIEGYIKKKCNFHKHSLQIRLKSILFLSHFQRYGLNINEKCPANSHSPISCFLVFLPFLFPLISKSFLVLYIHLVLGLPLVCFPYFCGIFLEILYSVTHITCPNIVKKNNPLIKILQKFRICSFVNRGNNNNIETDRNSGMGYPITTLGC